LTLHSYDICSFLFLREGNKVDRATAIEENRTALLEVVSGLFTMLGHLSGAVLGRIPRFLYRTVFRDLRPAEAAVRRLIVLAAIGLKVKLAPYRPMPKDKKISKNKGTNTRPAFRLDDPRLPLGAAAQAWAIQEVWPAHSCPAL
jgi:hypothetical protein